MTTINKTMVNHRHGDVGSGRHRLAPARLHEFGDGLGRFNYIAISGELDCRTARRDDRPGVEFSLEGNDVGIA